MSEREVPDGSVAVVTGAGSGLGRAFVLELADAGFRVAALGRHHDTLEETVSALPDDRRLVVEADVRDAASVDAAFAQVTEAWGRVDVLVNNAGVFGPQGTLDEVAVQDFADVLKTNVMGSVLCARAAFAAMRRQDPPGGRIINNGSISAHVPRPLSTAYTVSKHAISGLTRSLALDGRAYGISCGQIDIGNARTGLLDGVATEALQADGSRRTEPTMDAGDAARAVRLMATMPAEANVLFLTVTASAMPFVGRG